jgi:hypothetical protein
VIIALTNGKGTILQTITAVTPAESEFFRVVNWCYDAADMGHLVRAIFHPGRLTLRVTLPKADHRLERFVEQVADANQWSVSQGD